jgi:hypothetical protein
MKLINRAPGQGEHVILTACIVRKLLDKPTFTGPPTTPEQKYEMTKQLARVLAGRLKGKPLLTEHENKLGSVGEIVHSWIDEATGSWHIQAAVDTNTMSGLHVLETILSQREDGTHVLGEVSLSHQGDSPIEVSAVEKGARDDCTIDDVQIITSEQLKEIKNQCYKISPDEIPVHLPPGAPVVRASFASRKMTTTYTAIQKAPPATSYVEPPNFGLLGQQQHQAGAAAGQQKTAAETELQALKDKMEKLEQLLGTKLGQDNGPAAVRASAATPPQEQQQQQQQQQQNAPMQDTQPSLEEQGGIQALAALLSGPNILSNSQRGQAHHAVLQAAQQLKHANDERARLQKENSEERARLLKEKNELQEKLTAREADVANTRARMFGYLTQNAEYMSEEDKQTMQQKRNAFVNNVDTGFQQIEPMLIQASARRSAQMEAKKMTQEQASAQTLASQVADLLKGSQPLIQASHKKVAGVKRAAADAYAEQPQQIWKSVDNSALSEAAMRAGLDKVFEQTETGFTTEIPDAYRMTDSERFRR